MNKNTDTGRDFYEIRTYLLDSTDQVKMVEEYLETAAIPAMNHMGIEAVGVFKEMDAPDILTLRLLIVYPSMDQFAEVAMAGVVKEDVVIAAGGRYLSAQKDSPAYHRIENSLLAAFSEMPRITIPENKPRIFELRQYESHNETKAKKKIEMFNSAEIDIFLKTGLSPVFFGEMIIGQNMPNLTYMVTFADLEDQKNSWQSFIDSPDWKELSGREEYKDTVSNITKTMLVPTSYSQI